MTEFLTGLKHDLHFAFISVSQSLENSISWLKILISTMFRSEATLIQYLTALEQHIRYDIIRFSTI